MRGLTPLERRALVVDASTVGECIPEAVFQSLIALGRGVDSLNGFEPTPRGELALLVCPIESRGAGH